MTTPKKLCVLGLALLLPSCAKSYREEFLRRAKAKGWTEAQQYTALHYSYRLLFGRENPDKTYGVLYSRLPLERLVETIDKDLKNIGEVLGYEYPDTVKWVDAFELREYFERQERIYLTRRDRVRTAQLNQEFQEIMGTKSSWGHRDEFGYDHSKGYDPKILLLPSPLETYTFDSAIINDAKAKGILEEIERYTVNHKRTLDRKEQDPLYPDDPNQFIWRARQYALEIVKYKLRVEGEKPQDNLGNYVEGYRIRDDGTKESRPCLRAFLDGRGSYAVAVLDDDIENRDVGFGLPDFVERTSEGDIMSSNLIARLFPEDPRWKRVRPYEPPIRVEIARVGQEVELWEKAQDPKGWMVPISYKLASDEDNYNVRLKLKLPKNHQENHGKHKLFEIEYFVKEWTDGSQYNPSAGRVWEYFKPKAPFNEKLARLETVASEDTKKVRFVFVDGREDTGYVTPVPNRFIGEKPEAIAFTLGERRWLIKDEDGDGIYEKKKQISDRVDVETGLYSNEHSHYR